MSNSLDSDQARHYAGPDLGPNCFARLSVEDTGRQKVQNVPFFALDLSLLTAPVAEVYPLTWATNCLLDCLQCDDQNVGLAGLMCYYSGLKK